MGSRRAPRAQLEQQSAIELDEAAATAEAVARFLRETARGLAVPGAPRRRGAAADGDAALLRAELLRLAGAVLQAVRAAERVQAARALTRGRPQG